MRNLSILLILFFTGCAVGKKNTNTTLNDKKEPLNVVVQNLDNNRLVFQIINNSDTVITIYNPQDMHIEKAEQDSWQKLRILPCPCGAPCARSSESYQIPSQEKYTLHWNRYESWCGKRNQKGFQETVKEFAKDGKYRARIVFSVNNNKKEVLYKEFILN